MDKKYADYAVEQTVKLLAIDSPTGFAHRAAEWVKNAFSEMGYDAKITVKGGVLIDLGGRDETDGLLLEAHADTLGGMVAEVKSNGRLRLTALGGMQAAKRRNRKRAGVCPKRPGGGRHAAAGERVGACERRLRFHQPFLRYHRGGAGRGRAKTRRIPAIWGLMVGDIVCFEPRTRVTATGYIKSRFLDDKLSVGILLGLAKYMKDKNVTPRRGGCTHHVTVYEEVGHGGRPPVPAGVTEAISVDMGCVGEGLDLHRAAGIHLRQGFRRPLSATMWWGRSSKLPKPRARITPWTCIPITVPTWRLPSAAAWTFATDSSARGYTPATVTSAAMWTGYGTV